MFSDFLDALIDHAYSGSVVESLSVESGDVGVGNKTFVKCPCLGVFSRGVEYVCQDCGRAIGSYIWTQSGDGAGVYPVIEIRSRNNELVGALVIFDSPLASEITIQSQIAGGQISSLESFGFAKLMGFGELKALKLGELLKVNEVFLSDAQQFHDKNATISKLGIKDSLVSVFAFCEPMSKSDLARPGNSMISEPPDVPRPRVLAVLSSSLSQVAPIGEEYAIENWSSQVLAWRTSFITTEIKPESLPVPEAPLDDSLDAKDAPMGQSYCGQCGEKLLNPGQKFCQMCGTQLLSTTKGGSMSTPREVLIARKRFKEWQEYYKPIAGETYEVTDESRRKLEAINPNQIWSEVHGDDGSVLISGFWDHDEVLYWLVTERSWSGEPASFAMDMAVRVYCNSCDSSGETGSGDSCEKCDGDGYIIYDVD